MVYLATAGGGDAEGLAEGGMPFWGGIVRDTSEDPRGQVGDEGVRYAEVFRDEGISAEREGTCIPRASRPEGPRWA